MTSGRNVRILINMGIIVCVLVLAFALSQLGRIAWGYRQAGEEYRGLRAYAPAAPDASAPQGQAGHAGPSDSLAAAAQALAAINADYVGWLSLPGTDISYPMVRGADNRRYLHTTFEGAANTAGAIFVDALNARGFFAPHTVVYGHNMKDGSMFGRLSNYLNADYLAAHPYIEVTTAAGEQLRFRIFYAAQADVADEVYSERFIEVEAGAQAAFTALMEARGMPAGAFSVLTLSTCGDAGGDKRVLLHAAYTG